MKFWPMVIASKGRAGLRRFRGEMIHVSQTIRLFMHAPDTVPWVVLVEPQDAEAYRRVLPKGKVHVLPKNDQGLMYARQYALDMSAARGFSWFWMVDDDILHWLRCIDDRSIPQHGDAGWQVILDAQRLIATLDTRFEASKHPVGLAALEYRQLVWNNGKKPIILNGYADVAVALHARRLAEYGVAYDQSFRLKGDRDFTLATMAAGLQVVRTGQLGFSTPPNSCPPGGLQKVYLTPGVEEASSKQLAAKWNQPWAVYHPKKDGRPDVRIDWKAAAEYFFGRFHTDNVQWLRELVARTA